MSGKILVIKDPGLRERSDGYAMLTKVMFDIVGIDASVVTFLDVTASVKTDIERIKPDVVMSIGEKALGYICGVKGITKYAGTTLYSGEIPIVPVVSPGFLTHNPNYLKKFSEDILLVYQVSIGIDRVEASNQFKIVSTYEEVEELVEYLKLTGYGSFDFETSKLTDMSTFDPNFFCTSLSISFQQGSSYVIPLWHPEQPLDTDLIYRIMDLLDKEFFGNPHITKVGHFVKFDMHCAAWCGVRTFRGEFHDTMLMHQLLDENKLHNLKDIVREYYPRFSNYEAAIKDWLTVKFLVLAKYNALDSDLTLRLYWEFTRELIALDERIYTMYRNLTAPATKALFFMEERGMLVDKAYILDALKLVDQSIEEQESKMRSFPEVQRFEAHMVAVETEKYISAFREKIDKLELTEYKTEKAQENQAIKIKALKDELDGLLNGTIVPTIDPVNFNSPIQLKELLFSKYGFNFTVPKTAYKKDNNSTNKENLDLIKDKSGFLDALRVTRQLKKISSTYLKSIADKLDDNHKIHSSFNQHVAKTGRLSASAPNLQNIITRTKYKEVEDAVGFVKGSFSVPEGHTLVQADYSQAELRIIAYYADEPVMLQAYKDGVDMHEMTAANSRGYTLDDFRSLDPKDFKQYRFEAKAENFGFIYGISPEGFREYARVQYGINMTVKESERRRDIFFKKYKKLPEYHRTYILKARKFGYVRTFFGRCVRLPDIHSINTGVRGHAERNAINSPIQGTAGELTIFALALLHIRVPRGIQIINTIHDSILFYIPNHLLSTALPIIKHTMEKLPLRTYFSKDIDTVDMKVDFEGSTVSWKAIVPINL